MKHWQIVLCCIASLALFSCKQNDDDDDDSGSDSISNPLARAFPVDLVIASPYAQTSGTTLQDPSATDAGSRSSQTRTLVDGDGGSCAYQIPDILLGNDPSCYGPDIQFTGHPDDNGSSTSTCGSGVNFQPQSSDEGCLPSGDLGIWQEEENGEACMAAKLNYEIEQVGAYVDLSVKTQAMILCAARQEDVSLPDQVGSLDILDSVNQALEGENIGGTFGAIRIDYEDEVNGLPQYLASFTVETDESTISVTYRHRQLDENNNTYRGRAKILIEPRTGLVAARATAISVTYDTATSGRFEYQKTEVDSPADEDVLFDERFSLELPTDNNGFSWGIFDLDLTTFAGKVAYSWIAGGNQENVRSFVAETTGSVGSREGCGYFGFGVEFETLYDDPDAGWLDRMICNWAGPGHDGNRQGQQLVQRQCMRESSSGLMEATSNNVFYVPRNSCGQDEGSNANFEWRLDDDQNFSEFSARSHDLLEISGVDGDDLELPTRPTQI